MLPELTPAAERAFQAAARWRCGTSRNGLGPAEVLLGLLGQEECRAATLLAQHSIDEAEVRRRWPELKRRKSAPADWRKKLSSALSAALAGIATRLPHHPKPLVLATEHVLLGLAAAEGDVAVWLCEKGLTPEAVAAEIRAIYRFDEDPLPIALAQRASRRQPDVVEQRVPATILRALDAAANRAREGLRVVEDFVRFAWDDRFLMQQLKELRHDLAAAMARLPAEGLLACRDTPGDVGTQVSTSTETHRTDEAAVVAANFKRVEEALRSLEEFAKTLDASLALRLEQLRYRAYTLERAVDIARRSNERLAGARLYVLLDGRDSPEAFRAIAEQIVDAGVHMIQLRDKRLADRELLGRARQLRQLTRGTPTLFIVNDRPDLALLSGADGVHVGQEELAVADVRRSVGAEMLIGVSTHGIEQARRAVLDGADYLGLGPTFPSGTKNFDDFPGLEFVRQASQKIALPAFAIGGITLENLPQVLSSGIRRVAVSGAVVNAAEPGAVVRGMLELLAPAPAGN
jgi:thiamine-phosphate pyrophosphorylase